MATYTVAKGKHATAAAATVDAVTLQNPTGLVRISNRSAGDLYVRTDGTDPTV